MKKMYTKHIQNTHKPMGHLVDVNAYVTKHTYTKRSQAFYSYVGLNCFSVLMRVRSH